MMFIASGGAAPLLTDGLISGGGFVTFSTMSAYRETKDEFRIAIAFRFDDLKIFYSAREILVHNGYPKNSRSLPSGDKASMQNGSPRTTTSCIIIPKL